MTVNLPKFSLSTRFLFWLEKGAIGAIALSPKLSQKNKTGVFLTRFLCEIISAIGQLVTQKLPKIAT
jgi:predicted PolB exonuclease-like 3'-5' exonuclease